MPSGIGAGFGADMLQDILQRKFREVIAQKELAQRAQANEMQHSLGLKQIGLGQDRLGLDTQKFGEDSRQFDVASGQRDRTIRMDEQMQPVRIAHTQAQTGDLLRKPKAEQEEREYTDKRDARLHGYDMREIGARGANGGGNGTPYFTYQATFDPQGRPTGAIRFDARGGPPVRVDVSEITGGGQIKPPPGDLGKQSIVNDVSADQLDRLKDMFDKGAKNLIGPLEGRARAIGQQVPGVAVNDQYANFAAATAAFRNTVIKAITGAAMSEQEATRIRQQIPELTDKPEVWLAKADQTRLNLADLNKRLAMKGGATQNADPLGIRK